MTLENDSFEQLIMKRILLEQIILENKDDPRVREPKRQLIIINAEIERREETKEPPNLTVGLNTLNLEIKRQ
ncbi:MAG: hypothetical protein ACXABD_21825 [Candidatus Thorarchaeota archaeon]|jgi:hypothetical protein